MATRVKNASECIRTGLQYYPENIAHKYDKNVHNQVLRLCSTLGDITSLHKTINLAQRIAEDETIKMQNLVTDLMQNWYVTMERLENFCSEMRDEGYRVGYSMSGYLQELRAPRAEVVHYSEPVFEYEMSGGSYACYSDSAVTPYSGECITLYVRFDGPKGRGRRERLSSLIGDISREVTNSLVKTSQSL